MDRLEALIAGIVEEDRRLRVFIDQLSPENRESAAPTATMSAKEMLGHLAFWDGFTVRFFEDRLGDRRSGSGLADFEARDRQERKRLRGRPFAEVVAIYDEATAQLVAFLRGHWHALSDREHADLITPLRHRRHHRLLLERSFAAVPPPGDQPRAREQSDRA
ncbi:MAG: hypothetical protein ACYDIE_12705 [Candidatus Krumholzibacteriia bacterium]